LAGARRQLLPQPLDKTMIKHSRIRASRSIVATLAAVVALSMVGPVALAHAGDPVKSQYGKEVTKVAGTVGGGNDGTPPAPKAGLQKQVVGGLPFTGLDAVALLAVAVALMSMGFALRRLTAERHVS
jgi:hypothetical protein